MNVGPTFGDHESQFFSLTKKILKPMKDRVTAQFRISNNGEFSDLSGSPSIVWTQILVKTWSL